MIPVILSEAAERDLESIGSWIAADNPGAAVEFVKELRDVCAKLSEFPGRFPLVPRYASHGVRRRVYRNYLIFYSVRESSVDIWRILHGARAYETILFREQR
jgi:plasmid stabilization system protein ParE